MTREISALPAGPLFPEELRELREAEAVEAAEVLESCDGCGHVHAFALELVEDRRVVLRWNPGGWVLEE